MSETPEDICERAVGHILKKEFPAAAVLLQEALVKSPNFPEAWSNRGLCLLQLGHPFDAILHFEKAVALRPEKCAEYLNNMGASYFNLLEPDRAIDCYLKSLEQNPTGPEALMNMANSLKFKRKLPEAIEYYKKCVTVKPDYSDAHLNLSFALLENGEYDEGWKEFEWRWKSDQLPPRGLPYPNWEGEDLNGKHILLYAEQGLGDCLQFIRYVTVLKKKYPNSTVSVELRQPLSRLAKTVPGIDNIYIFGDKLPKFDFVTPMMSVPRIVGTTLDTIPWDGPYFSIEPERVDAWRQKIEGSSLNKGYKVGICWAGQSRPGRPEADAIDKRRSTVLSTFAPLAQIPGIAWVSLQKNATPEQLQPPVGMLLGHWMDEADDFYDTAALIQYLDLVITVDTSVAHVSAALGKPTWLLSRYDNCWRWLGTREDSPWYPSIRQFVQSEPGEWEPLMKKVTVELERLVEENSKKAA